MKERNAGKLGGIILLIVMILLIITFAILMIYGFTGSAVPMIVGVVGFVVSLIATLSIFIGNYNKLVRYENKVEESLSLIDVHLKMRFDLIPNLVETVKGYTKHEKEMFKKVTELRNSAMKARSENKKIEKANELLKETNIMLAVAEDYPDLKADKLFQNLMEELSEIESKLSASRRFYNSNINAYNNLVEGFPTNLIAGLHNFKTQNMFQIDVNEKVLPKVDLN